jgi:hypothetical protein
VPSFGLAAADAVSDPPTKPEDRRRLIVWTPAAGITAGGMLGSAVAASRRKTVASDRLGSTRVLNVLAM